MQHNNDNDWLLVELATGLQKLSCLSLDRTPAAEMLTGTAQAWLEAITDGSAWDEARDAERIAQAFRTLSRTVRRWPSPAEFLEALPPFRKPLVLDYECKPSPCPPEIAERMRELLKHNFQPIPPARVERETTPEQRDRIEQDLRAHYDRKIAAAGGDA